MSTQYSNVQTSNYDYRPELKWKRSEPFFGDLGYSLPLPWPMVTTVGFWTAGGIPEEKVLITRDDPEYFAVDNKIRSTGGLPSINPNDPIYKFKRSDYTVRV